MLPICERRLPAPAAVNDSSSSLCKFALPYLQISIDFLAIFTINAMNNFLLGEKKSLVKKRWDLAGKWINLSLCKIRHYCN